MARPENVTVTDELDEIFASVKELPPVCVTTPPTAVTNASADRGSDVDNADVEACVLEALKTLAFPAAADGNPIGVIAPVLFGTGQAPEPSAD